MEAASRCPWCARWTLTLDEIDKASVFDRARSSDSGTNCNRGDAEEDSVEFHGAAFQVRDVEKGQGQWIVLTSNLRVDLEVMWRFPLSFISTNRTLTRAWERSSHSREELRSCLILSLFLHPGASVVFMYTLYSPSSVQNRPKT